jgi:dCTP deaminase
MLSHVDIEKELERGARGDGLRISPLALNAIQPASVDLRIDDGLVVWRTPPAFGAWGEVDLAKPLDPKHGWTREERFDEAGRFVLDSGAFALASTVEHVYIPPWLVARLEGRSSLGRMGLLVHVTAGFIDPGFHGQITLELFNANPNPLVLHRRMTIAQLSLFACETPATRPYRGKYQGQRGPTLSRISEDVRFRGKPEEQDP